jgi:hypothetical protein
MNRMPGLRRTSVVALCCLGFCGLGPERAAAHCDTLDGPVVAAAKEALSGGEVTAVLKWVKPEYDEEVRAAFAKTVAVRKLGTEARELADMYFFETVVRLHRLGEGEGYTGLKPAGTDPGPAVRAADKALETADAEAVTKLVTDKVDEGIRARLREAVEKHKSAEKTVDDGRAYVAAYVTFVHYVEGVYDAASHATEHSHAEHAAASEHKHECSAAAHDDADHHRDGTADSDLTTASSVAAGRVQPTDATRRPAAP